VTRCGRCIGGRLFLDLYEEMTCILCGCVIVSEADLAEAHQADERRATHGAEGRRAGDVAMRKRQERKRGVTAAHGRGKWM